MLWFVRFIGGFWSVLRDSNVVKTLMLLFLSRQHKCLLTGLFLVSSIRKRNKVGFSFFPWLPFAKASIANELNPVWRRVSWRKFPNSSHFRCVGNERALDFEFSVAPVRVAMEEENCLCRRVVDSHFLSNLAQKENTWWMLLSPAIIRERN